MLCSSGSSSSDSNSNVSSSSNGSSTGKAVSAATWAAAPAAVAVPIQYCSDTRQSFLCSHSLPYLHALPTAQVLFKRLGFCLPTQTTAHRLTLQASCLCVAEAASCMPGINLLADSRHSNTNALQPDRLRATALREEPMEFTRAQWGQRHLQLQFLSQKLTLRGRYVLAACSSASVACQAAVVLLWCRALAWIVVCG